MLFSISELQKETLKQFNCFVILFYIRVINTATQVSSIGTSPKKKKEKRKRKNHLELTYCFLGVGIAHFICHGRVTFRCKELFMQKELKKNILFQKKKKITLIIYFTFLCNYFYNKLYITFILYYNTSK